MLVDISDNEDVNELSKRLAIHAPTKVHVKGNCTHLTTLMGAPLHLEKLKISSIIMPSALLGINVNTLDLRYNCLSKLPPIDLPNLYNLDLSYNDLECLPQVFKCPKLLYLNVEYNRRFNRLCDASFEKIFIKLFGTQLEGLLRWQFLVESRKNFKLAKLRYRSIVTLLAAKPFAKDVTRLIARKAYHGWF